MSDVFRKTRYHYLQKGRRCGLRAKLILECALKFHDAQWTFIITDTNDKMSQYRSLLNGVLNVVDARRQQGLTDKQDEPSALFATIDNYSELPLDTLVNKLIALPIAETVKLNLILDGPDTRTVSSIKHTIVNTLEEKIPFPNWEFNEVIIADREQL